MKTRDYYSEQLKLKSDICDEIMKELKRLNRNINVCDEPKFDFFSIPLIKEMDITVMKTDGSVLFSEEDVSLRTLLFENSINLNSAIVLLSDLKKTP
jgi:hypothetical protein